MENQDRWITGLAIALVVFLFILGVFLKFRNRPITELPEPTVADTITPSPEFNPDVGK